MVKQRHTPIRTCVACRETDEKRDLLRIVRQPDGILHYDPKGKLSGRGAYVCARTSCIALARKQKKLERSLKVSSVPEDVFVELNAQAALNPSPEAVSSTPPTLSADTEPAPLPATAKQKSEAEPRSEPKCSHKRQRSGEYAAGKRGRERMTAIAGVRVSDLAKELRRHPPK